jgi:Zn-dependent protease with chaperone function
MSEAVFPVLGAAFVALVLLPLSALATKVGLTLLERAPLGGPLHALNLRYLLLTGSSLLPLAWFMSAGLHQLESGTSALACLLDHAGAAHCLEPAAFALALLLLFNAAALPLVRRSRAARPEPEGAGNDTARRIARIIDARPMLHALRDRYVVTAAPEFTLGTLGWSRPEVFIGADFAARLSDDMLASALGHELEHVRLHDPLRYFLLQLALAANPCGRFLLEPHAARWTAAHEARCDREAVLRGALPLPLADAIVRAARPSVREVAPLGARDTSMLRFRIDLLLAFAECAPDACRHRGRSPFPLAFALLASALVLPHQAGSAALDTLHTSTERALTHLLP